MTDREPQPRPTIDFIVPFEDGTVYILPTHQEDVFVDSFGHNPVHYPEVAERVGFVTSKYNEHQAWPSKYDGLIRVSRLEGYDPNSDTRYDFEEYYGEHWGNPRTWTPEGRPWGNGIIPNPPTMAQLAEGVMYQAMRGPIMQKALQQMGSNCIVMSAGTFVRDIQSELPGETA